MGIQIALCWSDECEKELVEMGFEKKEFYVKTPPSAINTKQQNYLGDEEFHNMDNPPFQFVTTSWWGAEPE